ncbi:ABC transporter permease [Labrys wisconsinensis]|uniref:Autoinducer 2 import system permease protein LsrD n=1 Tax=Labrys wisconsinensis TaxID=425677 RepID=A0ABU0J538_9HYPH|nr:ABC transporter permease [Labrys wisconsinensis]MDQ0468676.1 rhamnose transport system permease protein [Labrys wisconsinensis]
MTAPEHVSRLWRPSAWEAFLVIMILVAGTWSSLLSPYYLSFDQILYSSRQFLIPGLLALGLMVVVVTGEIDISLASTLAVGAVLLAKCSAFGVPVWLAAPAVVLVGALLGAFNGLLVARFGLPSLAVTLGTMGAYRGLAFIIGSEIGYTDFDDSYLYVGSELFFELVPVALVLFTLVTLGIGVLMHRTVFGRRCFAVGNNREAARIAGIGVTRLKIQAYALAGALAGLAALVWIGQYGSARGDNADGLILFVVTAVVLAGVDINGGKGTVLGMLLALLLLGTLRNGLGLANIAGPIQTVVLGTLLVLGVLRPVATRLLWHARLLLSPRPGSGPRTKPARSTGP